jgi:hypothetical protein
MSVPAGATGGQVPQRQEVDSAISASMSAHTSAADPHAQYTTAAEAAAAGDASVATHVAQPDPHTQYALGTELAGYLPLIGGTVTGPITLPAAAATGQQAISYAQAASMIPAVGLQPKAYLVFNAPGGVINIKAQMNIANVGRAALGIYTISFATPFPNADYGQIMSPGELAHIYPNTGGGGGYSAPTVNSATFLLNNVGDSAQIDPAGNVTCLFY